MKIRTLIISLLPVFLLFSGFCFPRSQFKVIKDPKPNLKEKNFIRLEKVGEINEDLGNKEYLLMPFSIAMDRENNLFIYDRAQAKIFKFDANFNYIKSFGSVGKGPGEFSGSGRASLVPINVGLDNRLYAYDSRAYRVLIFDTDGEYIDQIKIKPSQNFNFRLPVVDRVGNLISQEFRDNKLLIFSYDGKTLLPIVHEEKKKEYLFVEERFYDYRTKKVVPPRPGRKFKYGPHEVRFDVTPDGTLLVLLTGSATLYVKDLNGKKPTRNFRIWPEQAVGLSKANRQRDKIANSFLFSRLFVDKDRGEFFYLPSGTNKDIGGFCIYKMNVDGRLVGVLYVPFNDRKIYPRFLLKQNKMFFGREDETIVIYKEVKQ